jgi:vacuolar-type H+-ATPase subunit I/STV1
MSWSNASNSQSKSQQVWQSKQFQKSKINYQNKSQEIHLDDYDSQYDENWNSKLKHDSSTYYNDDDYYENKSYDEILKSSITAKLENVQNSESNQKISETHFENILRKKLTQMTTSSRLTLKCRQCELKFYSNNKLHKHLRSDQRSTKHQRFQRVTRNKSRISQSWSRHVSTKITRTLSSEDINMLAWKERL